MALVIPIRPGFPLEPYIVEILRNESDPDVPLTGAVFQMQVRETRRSPQVLVSLSSSNDKITLVGARTIQIEMDANDTASIPRGGVFDLEMQFDGKITTAVMEGYITAQQPITR